MSEMLPSTSWRPGPKFRWTCVGGQKSHMVENDYHNNNTIEGLQLQKSNKFKHYSVFIWFSMGSKRHIWMDIHFMLKYIFNAHEVIQGMTSYAGLYYFCHVSGSIGTHLLIFTNFFGAHTYCLRYFRQNMNAAKDLKPPQVDLLSYTSLVSKMPSRGNV